LHGFYHEKNLNTLSAAELQTLDDESLAYDDTLRQRGHFIAAQALESVQTATTVRLRNGRVAITDGPFAETNEQIGGFILIEAQDLNEAIHLAAKIPPVRLGGVEVRPIKTLTSSKPAQETHQEPMMCPACIESAAQVMAGVISTGAVSAFLVRRIARITRRTETQQPERRQSVMNTNLIERPKVVSRAEWIIARKELLVKEKQLTRQRDEIDRQRRALPWVTVEKNYTFDGPDGPRTLADLFERRSQLIVSHFMFEPGGEEGCVGRSFLSDHVDGTACSV